MIYAYDQAAQMPIMNLYDSQIMGMAISAAKDMYEKGQQEIKDFRKEYGDFLSPFAKDMARYKEIIGGVRDVINTAYDNGIDLTKSPEGRMILQNAINSVDPAEMQAMRANAKMGYAYLDAVQKLRQAGKYSEAQELFDIMQSNGTRFQDFATSSDTRGQYNMWDRVSPIEATSLRDLTYKYYEHRTPRNLTAQDFKNDPMLRGVAFDPRYQYTGYLDSDLMKVAPGASASLVGDPRAEFFRDQARQKLIASGRPVTEEAIEQQFQRDIADANSWALVQPDRKADEFAKMRMAYDQQVALEGLKHAHDIELQALKNQGKENGGGGKYSAVTNLMADSEGAMKNKLMNYIDQEKLGKLNTSVDKNTETAVSRMIEHMSKDPSKYTKSQKEYIVNRYIETQRRKNDPNWQNKRDFEMQRAGLEGVAKEVLNIGKGSDGLLFGKHSTYFTDTPEHINDLLRSISSDGSMNTINELLKNIGNAGNNGGVYVTRDKLCGVGDVMKDVLSRGIANGKPNKSIEKAISLFDGKGILSQYNKSWTSSSFDVRNETDDTMPFNSNNSELFPTGKVLSGHRYYYIEVANNPNDFDECCWIKIDRNIDAGGGTHPQISSITERVDDSYQHEFTHTNIIGNPQSQVQGYNK